MSRQWIVCASCRGAWPMHAGASTYFEMQLMSQPCPRCEAYTLSCAASGELSLGGRLGNKAVLAETSPPLRGGWRGTER
jgi:hypothetical protein